MVSTPLHRGRQDLVVDQSCGDMHAAAVFRTQLSGCPLHSTEGDMTGLYINWGDMRAVVVFRVDAIVRVSTPLHRGRQDWVGRRNCQGVHSTPPRETGLGCILTGVTCVPLLSSG
ncbi:hypothetical protein GQ457_12G012420 [Hibiscus cannabinus]